uniref:U3 small nucleolar ribonucleoprotein protein IMP3 n=1 Tax=Phaeomonas parva TaxID=124430 RepID=A0A7S1U2R4_9STRA|mmetsp:Transcript_28734/g.91994  ORF Transcript_28734/g.91994 Transcript_28734/m.91994 type:complete len:184 (+) Transcript_28734:201-752(+)
MRKLKHHERKLLKKVDFLEWKSDGGGREAAVLRRYHVQDRDDYVKYNRLAGLITKLVAQLKKLPPSDPFRIKKSDKLLGKLYELGVIDTKKSLEKAERISAAAFCRRRLPVVMVRLKMAETVRLAAQYVEQGHVRVGPNTVTDPGFLAKRTMEDFVTWADSSKMKRHIAKYNDKLDDYDLLGN